MKWHDPIVKEIREIREAYAAQYYYDIQAIHRDLKEQERVGGRKTVSLPPRKAKSVELTTAGRQS